MPKKRLVHANSLIGTSNQIALCIGFVSGGRLTEMLRTTNSLWISLLLVVLSLLCFLCMKDLSHERSSQYSKKWEMLKETWSFVYKHPIYRRLFALDSIEYLAGSAWVGSVMLVFVQEILNKNEAWWGYIHGTYLFGTVLGGFTALWMNQWLKRNLRSAFIIGSTNLGILTILFAFSTNPLLSMVFAILMGIPYQMRDIALQTLLQTNADNTQLPKILAVHNAIISISVVIGVVLMGLIAKYYGPQAALLLSGALVLISAVMARALPRS